MREFSAVIFSISLYYSREWRIKLSATKTTLGVKLITEGDEEYNLPANTTDRGKSVVKTFRETERISAEEEEEEWLKWLLPDV